MSERDEVAIIGGGIGGLTAALAAPGADGAKVRFEGGVSVDAAIVVGADGVHSPVRASLFGADAPEFTGLIAWRGLVPIATLPDRVSRTVGTNWVGPGGHVVHYPVR